MSAGGIFCCSRSVPTMSFRQRLEYQKGFWLCVQAQFPHAWVVFFFFSVYYISALLERRHRARYISCQRSIKDPRYDCLPDLYLSGGQTGCRQISALMQMCSIEKKCACQADSERLISKSVGLEDDCGDWRTNGPQVGHQRLGWRLLCHRG